MSPEAKHTHTAAGTGRETRRAGKDVGDNVLMRAYLAQLPHKPTRCGLATTLDPTQSRPSSAMSSEPLAITAYSAYEPHSVKERPLRTHELLEGELCRKMERKLREYRHHHSLVVSQLTK